MAELSDLDWTPLTLKAYLEEQLVAQRRYFESIFEEQRRATEMASAEREKAAQALRLELARAIQEGDERLREHIANQIRQIEASLTSAELLEITRFQAAHAEVVATERAVDIASSASEKAIAKAETAAEKRFEAVNEFRAQLADQSSSFMPREVADAQFSALNTRIQKVESQQNTTAGEARANRRTEDRMQPWMIWAMGFAVAIVVFVANLLTAPH